MNISVVICTYNRCDSLRRTLQTFCQINATGLSWELLLLDNNSTDATARVVEEFKDKLPLRYIFESRQGKSHALNRSIGEAQGGLLLFTDDDVDVDPQWLQAYWDVAQRFPDATFFGGKVVACWEEPPPAWLAGNETWLLPVVRVDGGPDERWMKSGERPFFLGANMAVRGEIFTERFSYPENIGPSGSDASQSGNVRGEEMQLQGEFIAAGLKGYYTPKALINHRHLPHRMTERYLRRWYQGHGIAEVRSGQIPQINCWFGAPRYYWKELMVKGLKYFLTRWLASSSVWLKAETEFAFATGVIIESRHQK